MPQIPFTQVAAPGVPLDKANVDTDQLIPARFLKYPRDEDNADRLFHDLRKDPNFILNHEPYKTDGQILVADRNFGCGSSRESAVYVLQDWGFRAVIAPSFGDIFFNNSFKNGMLLIKLPKEIVDQLMDDAQKGANARLTVDLEAQKITRPNGDKVPFDVDPFRRHCLLNGLDDIGLTMEKGNDIDKFEGKDNQSRPWAPAVAAE